MNETPLDYIVRVLADGKRAELGRLLNIDRSTISGWDNPSRRSSGMAGTIPSAYIPRLLKIAEDKSVTLDLRKVVANSQ